MRSGHFVQDSTQSHLETYKDTDRSTSLANLFQCLTLDSHWHEKIFPISSHDRFKPSASPTTMHYCKEHGLVFLTSAEGIFSWKIAVSCPHPSLLQANQVQVHQFPLTGQVLPPPDCLGAPLLKLFQLINFISLLYIDEPQTGCSI